MTPHLIDLPLILAAWLLFAWGALLAAGGITLAAYALYRAGCCWRDRCWRWRAARAMPPL